MATKIIVTNKAALEKKYGENGTISILGSLNMMVAMDRQIRNISSFVLLLDNKEQMAMYGAKNVTDPQDEKQVKNAIDKVYAYLRPDYILLLGGCDIIPYQHLVHPADASRKIEGDLPYACSAPYGTAVDGFLQPGRNVSRLPDTSRDTEGADALEYVRIITNTCRQKPRDGKDYEEYFAVTAADFKESRQKMVAKWFGNSDKLVCCPPHGPAWSQNQYDCLFHYFALYGLEKKYQWFDDKAGENAVYECENDRLYLNAGTVVVSQCSYGAQLFDYVRRKPICNVYMENKAAAFLGCTGECSQGTEENREDALITSFLSEVKNKKPASEAFLAARKQVIKDPGNPTAEEKLVLAQWVLFGDGSCQLIS